jgi:hypothetical protein
VFNRFAFIGKQRVFIAPFSDDAMQLSGSNDQLLKLAQVLTCIPLEADALFEVFEVARM